MPTPEREQPRFSPFTLLMKGRALDIAEEGRKNGVSFDDVKRDLKEYRKKVRHINEGGN